MAQQVSFFIVFLLRPALTCLGENALEFVLGIFELVQRLRALWSQTTRHTMYICRRYRKEICLCNVKHSGYEMRSLRKPAIQTDLMARTDLRVWFALRVNSLPAGVVHSAGKGQRPQAVRLRRNGAEHCAHVLPFHHNEPGVRRKGGAPRQLEGTHGRGCVSLAVHAHVSGKGSL